MAKHRINLEPDGDVLDAADLAKLIHHWLADCRLRLPAYTVDGYEDKVRWFLEWWAGVAEWEPAFDSVGAYVGAAQGSLAATYRGYEAAQDWYRGEGLNKPFVA